MLKGQNSQNRPEGAEARSSLSRVLGTIATMPSDLRGATVLAFESRRAAELKNLIHRHGGLPVVVPSMREVPLEIATISSWRRRRTSCIGHEPLPLDRRPRFADPGTRRRLLPAALLLAAARLSSGTHAAYCLLVLFALSRNGVIRSIGAGKTIVVDCEEPSSSRVCR